MFRITGNASKSEEAWQRGRPSLTSLLAGLALDHNAPEWLRVQRPIITIFIHETGIRQFKKSTPEDRLTISRHVDNFIQNHLPIEGPINPDFHHWPWKHIFMSLKNHDENFVPSKRTGYSSITSSASTVSKRLKLSDMKKGIAVNLGSNRQIVDDEDTSDSESSDESAQSEPNNIRKNPQMVSGPAMAASGPNNADSFVRSTDQP